MMWMIFGMFLVTYIPRMIPMLFTKDVRFPSVLERWLSFIPYATLGALIFPGVLTVDENHPWIGLIGAVIAFLIAWRWKSILLPIISAILTVFLLQQLITFL